METLENILVDEQVQVLPGDVRSEEDEILAEDSPQALYAKAQDLRKRRRYAEAARTFQEVLNHPTEEIEDCCKAMVLADLAELAYWMGKYEEAERFGKQVLANRDSQSDTTAYEVLARIAIARFDFDLARQYQNRLVGNPVTYSLISCFISLQQGDVRSAQRSLVRVAEEGASSDPEYQTYQAYVAMLRGEAKSAQSLARAIVDQEGMSPPLMMMAAEVLVEAGDYAGVHQVLKELESACPESDRFLMLQSRFALSKGLIVQAATLAKQALEMNPENEHAQAVLMRCELEEGNEQVLTQIPELPEQRQKVLVLVLLGSA